VRLQPLIVAASTAALLTVLVDLGQGGTRVSAHQLRAWAFSGGQAQRWRPSAGPMCAALSAQPDASERGKARQGTCLCRHPLAQAWEARQASGAHARAAGADDFLPVLIFVVVHAAPPQLASNLEYVQRFRMQSRMASESAYFFTQLVRRPV
jgi:hypothetical protein